MLHKWEEYSYEATARKKRAGYNAAEKVTLHSECNSVNDQLYRIGVKERLLA